MIRTDKRMRICTALLVMLLVFIWGNSLMPGAVSQAISDWVKNFLFGPPASARAQETGSGIIRKLAHFTEFAALGATLGWLFGMLQKKKHWPFLWGALAGCLDETIQAFVPERAPGFRDVLIDSCGVLAGMSMLYLGHSYLKKRSTNQSLEDK